MAENPPSSPSLSQLPPVPSSPTYSYASTVNPLSHFNLPVPPPPCPAHAVLTKADLERSQTAYADLLSSAKGFRVALATLSTAASAFGCALEACARLKEARADAVGPPPGPALTNNFTLRGTCTADSLLTVAGLQHLVANHQQILSETVYRAFEVPLLHEIDKWREGVADEEQEYERSVTAQSREIRRLEKDGLRLHRQRRRDVASFREHLVVLTTKLDGLTTRHAEHARTLLRESQETSVHIVDASCSLVRAEVDIFESLARKGWTGGGLDDVLEKGSDLFAAEDTAAAMAGHVAVVGQGEGSTLFSILPPKSILADSGSDLVRGHARADSLLIDADRYQGLAGAVGETATRNRGDPDNDSVFSDLNRPRGAVLRPFSPPPQPVKLNPNNLIDGLGSGLTSRDGAGNPALHLGVGDEDEVIEEPGLPALSPWRDEGLRKSDSTDAADPCPDSDAPRERGWSLVTDRANHAS